MDWTEGEARLSTLERDVTCRQRLARENWALAREDGHPAVVERDLRHWRWLGGRLWRRLLVPAEPAPIVGDPIANVPGLA